MEVCDIACNVLVYKHRSTDIIIAGSFDVDRMSPDNNVIPISHIAMTLSPRYYIDISIPFTDLLDGVIALLHCLPSIKIAIDQRESVT